MEIYLLEYYKETEYEYFDTEAYNLIGIYSSEEEAQQAREDIAIRRNINRELLFVSQTIVGRLGWEGGFVRV